MIREIYRDADLEENHNYRFVNGRPDLVEAWNGEKWVRTSKNYLYDKMIYMACGILEYNIAVKYWTDEFREFLRGMGGIDNDELLEMMREEVEITLTKPMLSDDVRLSPQEAIQE